MAESDSDSSFVDDIIVLEKEKNKEERVFTESEHDKKNVKIIQDANVKSSRMLIEEAVKENKGDFIEKNFSVKDEDFDELVHTAVSLNNTNALRSLLKAGCSSVALNNVFKRPIQLAVEGSSYDTIPILLKYGASMDIIFKGGMTLLHLAAKDGNLDGVQCILDHKSDLINVKNHFGETAMALSLKNYHYTVVKALIEAGVDPNDLIDGERTALHIASAADKPKLVNVLIELKANIEKGDNSGRTPLHVATGKSLNLLLSHGADVRATCGEETPLCMAVQRKNIQDVRALIDHDPENIEGSGKKYIKPLAIAARNGLIEIVQLLMEVGADARGNSQDNPIREASVNNHIDIVNLLLENGAKYTSLENEVDDSQLNINPAA